MISPREAFGNALVLAGKTVPNLIVIDGDVQNSTFTEYFAKKFPSRFIQGYIAEQNAVGMAVGLSRSGKLPVFATFAAFFSRSHDQLRMAQYAETPLVFVGTHAGVSIGADGASQMGLDDIAMFRGFFGAQVFAACDPVSAEKLLVLALKTKGIAYLRIPRNPAPVLYSRSAKFFEGGFGVLKKSATDRAAVLAHGVTVQEGLKVNARVIDCYSLKPLSAGALRRVCKGMKTVVVVEDHAAEGGLADAVRSALGPRAGSVISLAVRKIPKSGTPEQLLHFEGIDAAAIARAVRS